MPLIVQGVDGAAVVKKREVVRAGWLWRGERQGKERNGAIADVERNGACRNNRWAEEGIYADEEAAAEGEEDRKV